MTSPKLLQALTVAGATFFAAGVAHAGSIQTPALLKGAGNQILCIAVNATASPITATVRIFGVIGNATDTCVLEPSDPGGCQVFRDNDSGFCRITVSGLSNAQVRDRVRGSLISRNKNTPFTTDAVVQAQ